LYDAHHHRESADARMTDSHDALYRAICAKPDEDTPRLAFADLLEEHGDALRARFIRTQIALSRGTAYDAPAVNARLREPDAAHGWTMAHTLPKLPTGFTWRRFEFRRGFPWKVTLASWDALASGDELFATAPVQALDVDVLSTVGISGGLWRLAEWPHLARLRRLDFAHGRFDANDVHLLTEAPGAERITELAFAFDALEQSGLAALAGSELFARLSSFELRTSALLPALLVDALGAAREPGVLDRVCLQDNGIGRDDAAHLFALPALRNVRELDLSDNPLTAQGVRALAESDVPRGLRSLNLSRTRPGVPGVRALLAARGLEGLRALDLSDNALGPVAARAVAVCAALRGLRCLNVSHNPLGDAGADALAGAGALAGLLELELRDAQLTDAGAEALAASPHLGGLIRLDARDNELTAKGRAALSERFGDRAAV
jgi:uncharacterized protein (TIGR02996 family)